MIHGITPGPTVMTEQPDMFWGLVMSFWIGNVLLVFLNIPLIGIWVRLLQVPYHDPLSGDHVFICIGVYSVNLTLFDVWLVAALRRARLSSCACSISRRRRCCSASCSGR